MEQITDNYVEPHNKISREVKNEDLETVKKDGEIMHRLNFEKVGIHSGGLSVAHPQINNQDPLRFFVTREGEYVINPKIMNHTKHTVDSLEGCLSFPYDESITVQRYNIIDVIYQTLDEKGITELKSETVRGKRSKVFQHEIDHFDGKYIFKIK
jgi:peptide deformylase